MRKTSAVCRPGGWYIGVNPCRWIEAKVKGGAEEERYQIRHRDIGQGGNIGDHGCTKSKYRGNVVRGGR